MKREHIVSFTSGHDCAKFECKFGKKDCQPGKSGFHGVHGLEIKFVVKGAEGAVQFVLFTHWLPQYSPKDKIGYRGVMKWSIASDVLPADVLPADLGYHSKTPRHDGQEPIIESCEFTDGEPCYYDGSGLNANDAMYALVNGGDAALWEFLEAYYACVFHDGEYPEPREYSMPLRSLP